MTRPNDRTPTTRLAQAVYWAALLAPFVGMLLVRAALGPGLGLDDGEWLAKAQVLQWGYDLENPPLAMWLGWAWTRLLGVDPVAIWTLRALLLALATVGFYAAARLAGAGPGRALAAGLAPFSLIYVGWVPLVAYSHSVLLLVAMAWSLAAMLWLARAPSTAVFLLLAVAIAAGLLAKYNYVAFLAGLFAAALAVPGGRAWLRDPRAWAAVLAALVLFLPHALWMVDHLPGLLAHGAINIGHAPGAAGDPLAALVAFAGALGMFALPGLVLLGPLGVMGAVRARCPVAAAGRRALAVQAAVAFTVLLAGAVAFDARTWPTHYLYPLAGVAVLAAVAAPIGRRWTAAVLLLVAAVQAVGWIGVAGNRPDWPPGAPPLAAAGTAAPLVAAAGTVRTGGGPVLVAAPPKPPLRGTLTGAVRVAMPAAPVLTTRWPLLRPGSRAADGCTLVWTGPGRPAIVPPGTPLVRRDVRLNLSDGSRIAGTAAFWADAAACRGALARLRAASGVP